MYLYLLVHINMDDGNFIDECGHTVTNNGVTINSANEKFGSGSAYFNGTSSYLSIANNGDLQFGNGNFTIDTQFYLTGRSGYLFFSTDNAGWSPIILWISNITGKLQLYLFSNGTSFDIASGINGSTTLTTGWHHVALVRNGINYTVYLDGKVEITTTSTLSPYTSTEPFTIGRNNFSNGNTQYAYFDGYIDEFRISIGIARWTSDFTPPTAPYSCATGISLNKMSTDLTVGQTDTLTATMTPYTSTNKAVTWTSSDTTIVTVDSNGIVTAVKEGTATITATTTDGSNLSASCTVNVTSATTTPPSDDTGNAILTITMTNGNVKQYTVDMSEVNDFMNWYNNRSSGSSSLPYYTFDKTNSLQPFSKETEYLIFDKISSFEVDQYNK